jgi:hypothetical protein
MLFVAMATIYITRIRFSWHLVHLIDDGLVGGDEGQESSHGHSYGMADLVWSSCFRGGLCVYVGSIVSS